MRYNNYHKHTHYSNIQTLDVIVKPMDYIKRAKELGHTTYFTTEHGWAGNVWEAYTLCKENNLKCIYAAELYYVNDRFEKDRGNYHLNLIAKNNDGFKDLNRIISKANTDGFYYKPRIDKELLLSLNPENIYITTACIGSPLFKWDTYIEDFLLPIKNHFKNNFFLEVQNHNDIKQKEWNKKILFLSDKYNIEIIHGNDSHYINPEDSVYRDMFLNGKGVFYSDESDFLLDYPEYNEIVKRYEDQSILNNNQILEAINNTLVFDECEDLGFTKEFKIPKIHKDNSNERLKKIVIKEWNNIKHKIPKERHKEYLLAIQDEIKTIIKCGMADYFILDYEIVKKAVDEYGAIQSRSGRGSAVSFIINKILKLTEVDRIKAPISLYPSRFMTAERILNSKSLPDIDLNFADVSPVIKASKDILGEDGIYYMVAFKPLQDSSAFRLWCKAKGMAITEYNEVAKNLNDYLEDPYWKPIIEESKIFVGVIESISPSPCSFLLLDKSISEEVGLIKIKDEICCCLDGYQCDYWKFLKNDYLTVKVYKLISEVYKKIGRPIDNIETMLSKVTPKTWKLYEDGITTTLNQADSDHAKPLIMKYKPTSLAELSAWVAAIRPGFASLLNKFLNREEYSTGVIELDNLLEDSFHYMLYQESIMKFLQWLGIPEKDTYDIIKKISKKKFTEDKLNELKEKLLNGWIDNVGNKNGFNGVWKVIEDAVSYAFNASHSLSVAVDSLYGAYLKAEYPLEYMYVALNLYNDDIDRTNKLIKELDYFNIKLESPKFRYSKGNYTYNKTNNSIYKGVGSIKYLNETCANQLYELRDNKYNSFIDLLKDIQSKVKINCKQLTALIKLDYFSEFGKSRKLLDIYEIFTTLNDKKQFNKNNLPCDLTEDIFRKYSAKETAKIFKDVDVEGLIVAISNSIEDKEILLKEKISAEIEYLGYPTTILESNKLFYVLDIDEFKNKKSITRYLTLYDLNTGDECRYRMSDFRLFHELPIYKGDVIHIISESKVPKKRKTESGKWEIIKGEFNNCLDTYEIF